MYNMSLGQQYAFVCILPISKWFTVRRARVI